MDDEFDEKLDPDETGLLALVRVLNRAVVPIVEKRRRGGWAPNEAPFKKLEWDLCSVCVKNHVALHHGETVCSQCRDFDAHRELRELNQSIARVREDRVRLFQAVAPYLPRKWRRTNG